MYIYIYIYIYTNRLFEQVSRSVLKSCPAALGSPPTPITITECACVRSCVFVSAQPRGHLVS